MLLLIIVAAALGINGAGCFACYSHEEYGIAARRRYFSYAARSEKALRVVVRDVLHELVWGRKIAGAVYKRHALP